MAFLLPSRGWPSVGLAAFLLAGLASFLVALFVGLLRGGIAGGGRLGALGGFLALGRALLGGGSLGRRRLLRRNVRALFRNGGGFASRGGFFLRLHGS